jgi:hypothetical protein
MKGLAGCKKKCAKNSARPVAPHSALSADDTGMMRCNVARLVLISGTIVLNLRTKSIRSFGRPQNALFVRWPPGLQATSCKERLIINRSKLVAGSPDATIFPVRSQLPGRVASEERGDRVFHIIRDRNPRDDPRPHFERWGGDQILSKGDRLQIIMKVRSPAAMDGVAPCPYSRSAFSPVAGPAQVGTSRISEEDISPAIKALSVPGELTA